MRHDAYSKDAALARELIAAEDLPGGSVMAGLRCDCCKLPTVPLGGEAMCECPCDLCRGDQICPGCREILDCCVCDPYGDDRDDLDDEEPTP